MIVVYFLLLCCVPDFSVSVYYFVFISKFFVNIVRCEPFIFNSSFFFHISVFKIYTGTPVPIFYFLELCIHVRSFVTTNTRPQSAYSLQ